MSVLLTREEGQKILVGENLKITVVKVRGNKVTLEFKTPTETITRTITVPSHKVFPKSPPIPPKPLLSDYDRGRQDAYEAMNEAMYDDGE